MDAFVGGPMSVQAICEAHVGVSNVYQRSAVARARTPDQVSPGTEWQLSHQSIRLLALNNARDDH